MTSTDDGAVDDKEELRRLARELMDAHDAYVRAPTKDSSYRLARLRRRLEEVLAGGS